MSAPRFLADHNLRDAIVDGVTRRDARIEFAFARDLGLSTLSDADVLEFAASRGLIVVSHDTNTLPDAVSRRLQRGERMPGVLLVHQRQAVSAVIESILLIASASEAEEWMGRIAYLPL